MALSMPTADASTPRTDVGDVGEFQQPLNRAVLAVGAVEHGEDDVEAQPRQRRRHLRVVAARLVSIDEDEGVVVGTRRQEHFAAAANASGFGAELVDDFGGRRGRGRPVRRAPSARPSRCGSRSARSGGARCWRRPWPPRRATPRARWTDHRRERLPEDAWRASSLCMRRDLATRANHYRLSPWRDWIAKNRWREARRSPSRSCRSTARRAAAGCRCRTVRCRRRRSCPWARARRSRAYSPIN